MSFDINEIDLRRVDLNLLLVFTALMRARSVRAAAGRLFLGPSAVSMALGRLRRHFGDPLFVRAPSGMEPTAFALALHERVAPALAEIGDAVLNRPAFDPAIASRAFRFASPDDLEIVLLPRLLARLEREAPRIDLIVRAADLHAAPGQLDAGEADLALTATPPRLEGRHRHEVLYSDGFAVLCDAGRLGLADPLSPAAYAGLPHALLSPAGAQRGLVDETLAAAGLRRRVVASVPRFSTLPFLLKGARLVANMPAVSAAHYARAFGLACLALPLPSPTFDVALVWHARSDRDPAQIWFRGIVREEVIRIRDEAGIPRLR
jgi:LysR family transcriptional regulator, mexEF-oprN operon transcriptional activator